MAFTPPYSVTVPTPDTDRDSGQTEVQKWTLVRNFINDSTPVISTGMAGPAGPVGPAGPAGPPGGLTGGVFSFTFSNTTTAGATAGGLRFNNTAQNSATQIYVSETDTDGLDVTLGLSRIQPGWKIYVQDFDNAANSITYTVTTTTDSGAYWTFGVTLASATGTNPIPTGKTALQYISPATIGIPPGGTTGQSLTKASGTNFDTVWATVTGGGGGTGVSTDAGNVLTAGADSKPWFNGVPLLGAQVAPTGQVLSTVAREITPPTEVVGNFLINEDGTSGDPNAWPERMTFWFHSQVTGLTKRTGYFNEYGEVRGMAARPNTVAARFFAKENASDPARNSTTPILEICDDRDTRSRLFAVMNNGTATGAVVVNWGDPTSAAPTSTFSVKGTGNFTGGITVGGNVVGANIGNKVTSGTTAPSSPALGDVWIDSN